MGRTRATGERVRLKPADSFDLLRLIARSQSDPRKAVAELVQNSLDAGAATVRVAWFTHAGKRALSIRDDGQGIFPELDRPEALKRIASTIGHSHKANLTPGERHRQMMLGKYGIGLLGFRSVGRRMEIRTRVSGSAPWALHLEEDRPEATIAPVRAGHLPLDETFTEVLVTEVHPAAAPAVKPRRLAAYIAGEMRGQLLARGTRLEIHDRVARGRSAKLLVVRPKKFQGAPLSDLTTLPVPEHEPARVDLYLVGEGEERRGSVSLACGGATVLDDLSLLDGADTTREPWNTGRFEGVVDFPDLEVAPGTRRGFVPDEAAEAFLAALPGLEARLRSLLAEEAAQKRQVREQEDVRNLRRLFRSLPRLLPHYALLDVRDRDAAARGADAAAENGAGKDPGAEVLRAPYPPASGVAGEEAGLAAGVDAAAAPPVAEPAPELRLFPPGPLASVVVSPKESRVPVEGERRLVARARDADARRIEEGVEFSWRLSGPGTLEGEGDSARYRAPADPCEATVVVEARQGEARASAEAAIRVEEAGEGEGGSAAGVPDPEIVFVPGEAWRSRVLAGRWEVNSGHADYRRAQSDAKARLRYLVHLFAKEVVVRNFGSPADGALLERMVEVLTHVGEGRAAGRPPAAPPPAEP